MNAFLCVVLHFLGSLGFEVMGELTAEVFHDIFISFLKKFIDGILQGFGDNDRLPNNLKLILVDSYL